MKECKIIVILDKFVRISHRTSPSVWTNTDWQTLDVWTSVTGGHEQPHSCSPHSSMEHHWMVLCNLQRTLDWYRRDLVATLGSIHVAGLPPCLAMLWTIWHFCSELKNKHRSGWWHLIVFCITFRILLALAKFGIQFLILMLHICDRKGDKIWDNKEAKSERQWYSHKDIRQNDTW